MITQIWEHLSTISYKQGILKLIKLNQFQSKVIALKRTSFQAPWKYQIWIKHRFSMLKTFSQVKNLRIVWKVPKTWIFMMMFWTMWVRFRILENNQHFQLTVWIQPLYLQHHTWTKLNQGKLSILRKGFRLVKTAWNKQSTRNSNPKIKMLCNQYLTFIKMTL